MRARGVIILTAVLPLWGGLCFYARGVKLNQVESAMSPTFMYGQAGAWVALLATILGLGFLFFDCVRWLRKKT
jgi:fumarate reductase subunit D